MPGVQQQWALLKTLVCWMEVGQRQWAAGAAGPSQWAVGPSQWAVEPSQWAVAPLGQMTPQPRPAASSDRVLER